MKDGIDADVYALQWMITRKFSNQGAQAHLNGIDYKRWVVPLQSSVLIDIFREL